MSLQAYVDALLCWEPASLWQLKSVQFDKNILACLRSWLDNVGSKPIYPVSSCFYLVHPARPGQSLLHAWHVVMWAETMPLLPCGEIWGACWNSNICKKQCRHIHWRLLLFQGFWRFGGLKDILAPLCILMSSHVMTILHAAFHSIKHMTPRPQVRPPVPQPHGGKPCDWNPRWGHPIFGPPKLRLKQEGGSLEAE